MKNCCQKSKSKGDQICNTCKKPIFLELNVTVLGSGGCGHSQIIVSDIF